ncbi:MAG: CRISPR-associated endonuclease Cas2, partial [Oscillospiraceae bacterium]|nr:CRISPR-associated endonuclease Cas2 [Oscillospiraceae bacterium]
MMVLVVYDIDMEDKVSGAKRLRNIAKLCERYGVRV